MRASSSPKSENNGQSVGGVGNDGISIAHLPPPPPPSQNESHHTRLNKQQQQQQVDTTLLGSRSRSISPPDPPRLAAPTFTYPGAGPPVAAPANTPSSDLTIKRCDLMWGASSGTSAEPFTPVVNCEIQPVIILGVGPERYDDDDIEVRKPSIRMYYRWRRGPARAVCFFHPHRVATLQCTVTLRCFCGAPCFHRGQVQLRRFYLSGGKCAIPRQINEFSYGVPCEKLTKHRIDEFRDPDSTHYELLRSAGLVLDPRKEIWTPVGYSRDYSPCAEDVGHQLRFELVIDVVDPSASDLSSTMMPVVPNPNNMRVISSAADNAADIIQRLPNHAPRSSPVNRRRNMGRLPGDEEANFWGRFDASPAARNPDRYKMVETSCVLPQAPLIERRPMIPVGLLALLGCTRTDILPQRIIIPGTPLAEALGIGVVPSTANTHRLVKRGHRYSLGNGAVGPPSSTSGGGNTEGSVHLNSQNLEKHRASVRERRVALLTEQAFTGWSPKTETTAAEGSGMANSTNNNSNNNSSSNNNTSNTATTSSGNKAGGSCDGAKGGGAAMVNNGTNVKQAEMLRQHLQGLNVANAPRIRTSAAAAPSSGNLNVATAGDVGIGEGFSIMTWNVLADIYATAEAYPYSAPFVLAWNYRRERILAEILVYNPDIICLQEVQGDHFEDFFAPALLRRGYEGLYKQKTSRVFRGSGRHKGGRYVCDGCATFFRVPKFQLVDHFGIEFARVAPPASRSTSSAHKADKRLNKDNVALVLCLEQTLSTSPGARLNKDFDDDPTIKRRLVVANTHILANPEAPDVKIWQANTLTSVLTEYLDKTVTFNSQVDDVSRSPVMPGLVVCGDFNSMPDSALFQLMTTGSCDPRHAELQASEACQWLSDIPLGHGLTLRSSYGIAAFSRREAARGVVGGTMTTSQTYVQQPNIHIYEPEFTNYTHQYVGCLDYIFFDDRSLKVIGTLDLVKEVQLLEESYTLQLSDWALPSPQRPSDHLLLLSRFEWTR